MIRSFEARDGRNLDTLVGGEIDSTLALVCHHGTPSDATIWSDWNEIALENRLSLVSISRPGYGLSDRRKYRSVSNVAEDVEDVADELPRLDGLPPGELQVREDGLEQPEKLHALPCALRMSA